MVDDFKSVLIYISIALRDFILLALKKMFLFFTALVIIILFFFGGLKLKIPYLFIISGILLLWLILFFIMERLFFQSQARLNHGYVQYLATGDMTVNKSAASIKLERKIFRQQRKELKQSGCVANRRTTLAHAIMQAAGLNAKMVNKSGRKEWNRFMRSPEGIGYLAFFVLLLFFELISLALGFGNEISTEFILFLGIIGFVFAYALYSVTVDPVICLIVQKRVIGRID